MNTANGGDSARKPLIYSKQMLLSLRDEDYCVCRPDDLIGKYYLSFVCFECLIIDHISNSSAIYSRRIFATHKTKDMTVKPASGGGGGLMGRRQSSGRGNYGGQGNYNRGGQDGRQGGGDWSRGMCKYFYFCFTLMYILIVMLLLFL